MGVNTNVNHKIIISSNKDEEPWIINSLNKILKKRKYSNDYISENIVLLMSGGMDSTILASLILEKTNYTIYPLFIRRGSRSQIWEEKGFDFFNQYYAEKYPNRFKGFKKIQIEVPPLDFKKYKNPDQLKKLGHPMRNVVLQSLAVQYASFLSSEINSDVRTVFTATVPDDSFPHSSLLSIRALTLLTCIDSGDWRWKITSPLLDKEVLGKSYKKSDLIKYAIKKGIPLNKTRTCIESNETPCMKCPECLSRIKAFDDAGVKYE